MWTSPGRRCSTSSSATAVTETATTTATGPTPRCPAHEGRGGAPNPGCPCCRSVGARRCGGAAHPGRLGGRPDAAFGQLRQVLTDARRQADVHLVRRVPLLAAAEPRPVA